MALNSDRTIKSCFKWPGSLPWQLNQDLLLWELYPRSVISKHQNVNGTRGVSLPHCPDIILKTDARKTFANILLFSYTSLPSFISTNSSKGIHFISSFKLLLNYKEHRRTPPLAITVFVRIRLPEKSRPGNCSRWPPRPLKIFSFFSNACLPNICLWPPQKNDLSEI